MGNNYQIYVGGARVRIEAELRPGRGGGADGARARALDLLRRRGVEADLVWVEHIPRLAGKARRVRPLAERDTFMASPSLLRR
jgi:hypothetical protein